MKIKAIIYIFCVAAFLSCQEEQVSPADAELRVLSSEEQELVRSNNQFAIALTQELTQQRSGNLFLSPFYVNMSLSMALNGAESATLGQMRQTLYCDLLDRLQINKAYNELNPFLQGLDRNVQLTNANGIWHHQDVAVRPLFRDMMLAYYDAGVEPIDYFNHKTPTQISKWVEDRTQGKVKTRIPNLIHPLAMYLVSATHIKGRWAYPFAKESTAPGTFYSQGDEEVIVPTMFTDQAHYRYFEDDQKTLIDIPYGNERFSMTILMPHPQDSLHSLIKNLDVSSYERELALADTLNHHLYLPKFSISSQLALRKALYQMGMRAAFSNHADFSGIFSDSLDLSMAELIHHAGIEINEEGTQAATPRAAAAINRGSGSVVRINRPFIFFIRENHSGAIMYTGVYQQP